jgi:glyoxylase-like metal-dependent hydrolase (beta-lactamase superfamily II)
MNQVTKNVFVETGYRGCNPGFVVTSEGVVMIDTPQIPRDALAYREIVLKHGKPVYLINTEPHGDHFTGNFFFDAAVCIAQQGTRDAIMKTQLDALKDRIKLQDPGFEPQLGSYRIKLPTITFSQSMRLYVGDHTFELIHLPGHTASETAVFIPEERTIFTGDNIFNRVQTFLHEALPKEWLKSLKTLKTFEADHYIPGHGEVCTKAYLKKQASFIKEWIAAIKEAIQKGWSLEEAQQRISFLDRYPMGQGLEAFGPELQKMNVARLYSLATNGQL